MKPFLSLLFVAFISTVILSCAKETQYLSNDSVSIFKAKVDGVLVECSFSNSTTYDISGKKVTQITGSKGTEGFMLDLEEFTGVGTYDLTGANSGIYTGNSIDQSTAYLSISGTAKITKLTDKVIEGTFEFKGENYMTHKQKTITAGEFSISLVLPVAPPPAAGDKSMSARVDGTSISFTGQAGLIKSASQGNMMSIVGVNGEKVMSIGFFNYKGVGTYDVSDVSGNLTVAYQQDRTPSGDFEGISGKVIITASTSTAIKGTYEFVGQNPSNAKKTITEGKFDMNYTTQSIP